MLNFLSAAFHSACKIKLVKKEIPTTFSKLTYAHIANFCPQEKQIRISISLQSPVSSDMNDIIITNYDVNNYCMRVLAKTKSESLTLEPILSYDLDATVHQPPYRVEIIHKKENERFRHFKFQVWYLEQEKTGKRPGLMARLGKIFPGPASI